LVHRDPIITYLKDFSDCMKVLRRRGSSSIPGAPKSMAKPESRISEKEWKRWSNVTSSICGKKLQGIRNIRCKGIKNSKKKHRCDF